MQLIRTFKKHLDDAKAELKGEAKSHARMIKQAADIPGISNKLEDGPAKPIRGGVIRMLDGKPMIFHTDGSLRHAAGRRVTKAIRKELKRARRAKLA